MYNSKPQNYWQKKKKKELILFFITREEIICPQQGFKWIQSNIPPKLQRFFKIFHLKYLILTNNLDMRIQEYKLTLHEFSLKIYNKFKSFHSLWIFQVQPAYSWPI